MSFKTIKKDFPSCTPKLIENNSSALSLNYYYNWDYPLIKDAINYAIGKNSIVVASAGNIAENNMFISPCELIPYPCYPAQYSSVIAVSGSDANNNFVDGWNYGFFVDLNAPGRTDATTGLWTTALNNGYASASGTSFSAPQVSALIALIKSINNSLSLSQVKSILENSADKVGLYSYSNGRNNYFGYGRINAYKALKYTIENFGGSFNQDITIPASDTLNIQLGKSLSFNSDCKLIVNGTLNAIGNSTNGITFNRSGSSGTWGGIQFNSGSTGSLDYCTITNASTGIYCYNSSPSIRHSTLDYNGTGLSLNYYSSPVLAGNNLRYNSINGIRCQNNSSPSLRDGGYSGSNVIRNNVTGIYASYSSNPNLAGYMLTGNSIFDNTGNEIEATYYCTINAERVFWGNNATIFTYSSSVTNTNPLPYNPNPNRSIIEKGEPVNFIASSETNPFDIPTDDLSQALEMQRQKRYDEAIVLFLEVFKKNKDELVGKYALTKIEECFTQSGRKDYLSFSDKEIKPNITVGNETYVIALELEAHQMINAEEYTGAINNLNSILTKYNLNEDIEKNTLFTLGSIYILFTENKRDAENYFSTLRAKYPDDDLSTQIEIIKGMGESYDRKKAVIIRPEPEIGTEAKILSEEISISNYPNPFNPETTIRFSLPQCGNVKLLIYDILGREVFSIAEGYYESGKHEVKFDGRSFSTGIYFYMLETGGKRFTNKMILMK